MWYLCMKLSLKEMNIVKMVLAKHVAQVEENTRTYNNLRFIVSTSLNIGISVLLYEKPCTEDNFRIVLEESALCFMD